MGYNYLTSVPGTSPRSTGCTNRGTGFGRRSPRRPRRPAPPVGCCPCHRTLQRPRRVSRTAPWSAAEVGRRSGLPAALLLSILCGGRRSHPASSRRTLISVGCALLNGEGSFPGAWSGFRKEQRTTIQPKSVYFVGHGCPLPARFGPPRQLPG